MDSEKDLGVTFQSDLKFDSHICNCVNKANRILGVIKRTFSFLDAESFIPLYKTLVRPHLEYATTIWLPYLQKHIFAIENVQRRATKLVPELRKLPYSERMLTLGIPTLRYRRERSDMIQVFKIVSDIDKLDTAKFFIIKDHTSSRTRGHKHKIDKKQSNTTQRQAVFSQRVPNKWNKLSDKCVNSGSIEQFKSNLNTDWKNHPLKFSI